MKPGIISISLKKSKVSLRLTLAGQILSSPFVDPQQVPVMTCRLIRNRIKTLVRQRQYQYNQGMIVFAASSIEDLKAEERSFLQALRNTLAQVDYPPVWKCDKMQTLLGSLIPKLEILAPTSGRFVKVWQSLLEDLNEFLTCPNLKSEIHEHLRGQA